jgi:Fe-S cluster assembly scaffold protein SufB
MLKYDFAGRTAIVTGGTRGIGAAITTALLRAGARVMATYASNAQAAEQFRQSLPPELASNLETACFDVSDYAACEQFFQEFDVTHPALDMMVQRRLLIVVGKNASIRLLACDHTQSPDYRYLNNQVVEIVAMQGSTIDYYDMEESNASTHRVSTIAVRQERDSNVLVDGITLLNGITRNYYIVDVDGEYATTQ